MSRQMAIPFALAPDGSVAVVEDPVRALADRVRALTATMPTQRVMRSTFGVPTGSVLFEWDPGVARQQLDSMVRQAVSQWEPSARVLTVTPVLSQDGTQVISAQVDISAGDPVASAVSAPYRVTVSANGDVLRSG